MSNNKEEFTLDMDSPSPQTSSKQFNLAQEEREGASLLEEERNRQQLLAENEDSEHAAAQHSNRNMNNMIQGGDNTGGGGGGGGGHDYSNGVVPIREVEGEGGAASQLDPTSSMKVGQAKPPVKGALEGD